MVAPIDATIGKARMKITNASGATEWLTLSAPSGVSGNRVFFVASEVAQLSLIPQLGDLAIRTDSSEMYAYQNVGGLGPGDLSSWYSLISIAGQKHVELVGDGAATAFTVNHGFGNTDLTVQTWQTADGQQVTSGVRIIDSFNISVSFAVAPAVDGVRVVITS